jgi:U3 small nucleolar RNA-associated protein 18
MVMMNCSSDEDKTSEGKRKAAWVDEDDNGLMVNLVHDGKLRKLRNSYAESTVLGDQYSRKLRTQFTNLSSIPTWASDEEKTLSDVESEDEHGGKDCLPISSLVAGSVLKKSHVLPGGILDIKQLKSCCLGKSAGGVSGIQFHPHANVLLATGTQRSAVIFQVDGEANPKLQSIDFENASLCMAKFSQDGKEILGVGSRQVFYVYDIGSGKVSRIDTKGHRGISSKFVISPDNKYIAFPAQNGYISLFSNKTRQWMFDLKMNGTVDDTAFSSGSQELLSIGSDGQIYVWDMRSRSCINKFTDQGCVHGTSLAVSSLDMYFACG